MRTPLLITAPKASEVQPMEPLAVPKFRRRRILVVDDNPVNMTLLAEMLPQIGHDPEAASDGMLAVALAQKEVFDLILMAIWMPAMDGIATTCAIRDGGLSAFCPVIGVTAVVSEEERERVLRSGMQDVLCKPLGLAQLSAYLTEFFADHCPSFAVEESFADVRAIMGDAMLAQMLESVLQDAELALTALRALEPGQNLLALRQVFHRAAGSASVIGAVALANALHTGESAIIAEDLEKLRSCDALIRSSITVMVDYLQQLQTGSI